jgi:hypothetical protein
MFPKSVLQRVLLTVLGQPFDGQQPGAVGLYGQHQTRPDGLAVHQDGTRAANTVFAANVAARQSQVLAQEIDQQGPWLNLAAIGHAVYRQLNRPLVGHSTNS